MTRYVEIAVNIPGIRGVFHYHLPAELEGIIEVGHLVIVPFGKQRVQGVVVRRIKEPLVPETRSVEELVDERIVLTSQQIELAQRMSEIILSSTAACIGLMTPPGLSQRVDSLYTIRKVEEGGDDLVLDDLSFTQKQIIRQLQKRGSLRGNQLNRALKRLPWQASITKLVKKGLVFKKSCLVEPKVRPKKIRIAKLAVSKEIARSELPNLSVRRSQALERRQKIVEYLIEEDGWVNVSWIYAKTGGNSSDLKRLEKIGLIRLGEEEIWRDPVEGLSYSPDEPPVLTKDQKRVWAGVQEQIGLSMENKSVKPILLHGVTGSGKTEIYLRAVAEVIKVGKQAIVLVPEIALTPQTIRRFLSRFPDKVGLLHSGLSDGERYDTWRRARTGEFPVVVGPRSALFTPFPNIGLIVVDECHDNSYYQSDIDPRYHARETAVLYSEITNSVCLFGSATPDVSTTYKAKSGNFIYLNLPSRIIAHREAIRRQSEKLNLTKVEFEHLEEEADSKDLPPVEIVDMRSELKSGNTSIFSYPLQKSITEVLDNNLQAILFLNRRGTSTYLFCRDCGYVAKCANCDLPLTYHQHQHSLLCHHCGYTIQSRDTCPSCKSERFRKYGTGTENVEAQVHRMFPDARTIRWDRSTTRKKGSHDAILDAFANHKADILIGTQMLAKGLDLPLVTLVGVILADVGMNFPDFRSGERTFQILTQVAGRAGRSPLGGKAIIQTYQPDHYVIQSASEHDYQGFYDHELEFRKEFLYPPFSRLVRLLYRSIDLDKTQTEAEKMAAKLQEWIRDGEYGNTIITGPVPCFYRRLGGYYRWHIILRGPDPTEIIRGRIPHDWIIEVDSPSLL